MNPIRLLEKVSVTLYPFRYYFIIFAFIVFVILSNIINISIPKEGYSVEQAFYITMATIGGISLFLGVLAMQLNPKHGELRTEEDDGWFVKSYNIFMKYFLLIVFIIFIILSIGMTVNAWISIK
jgi:hypothetical protein